jgi:hypothetical protein
VYLVCAILVVAFFGAIVAIFLAMGFSGVNSLSAFPLALGFARVVLLPGIIGSATLSVAMWYFWFNFDQSSWAKKTLWAVALYLFIPIGPALYYFFVYLRSADVTSICIRHSDVSVGPIREPQL